MILGQKGKKKEVGIRMRRIRRRGKSGAVGSWKREPGDETESVAREGNTVI